MEETKTETKTQKALTLQQKFVKLREAIPAIVQKQHSDGVKYKFAKIFDVYELLTPAMNEYGVNFDITEETATRHYENGDDKYYDSYIQQTKNGPRTVWVYEADLTITWTNADDPDDSHVVSLHALGTNDGGPDKAKGSAWTYCLKYYLFEKFGIDQGEDDPDLKDLSDGQTAPQDAAGQPTGARNGWGKPNTPPAKKNAQNGQKSGTRPLSDAQISRMYRIGEEAGYSKEQVDSRCAKKYGVQEPKAMTREQYDETCDALEAAKQTKQEEQGGTDNA
jgi:hypothetical protein